MADKKACVCALCYGRIIQEKLFTNSCKILLEYRFTIDLHAITSLELARSIKHSVNLTMYMKILLHSNHPFVMN